MQMIKEFHESCYWVDWDVCWMYVGPINVILFQRDSRTKLTHVATKVEKGLYAKTVVVGKDQEN